MTTSDGKNELQGMGQSTVLQFASFENAKNQLKTFSNRNSGDFGIDKLEVDGGFLWLGDHKVTGTELNKVTSQVQDYLIKINGFSKDVVKEIGHVYDALESLDKEYIPAILTAVKGAEIASDQAKAASEHARVAQEDIKNTVEEQKRILGVLEKHKEKLDKLVHLENIDDIWKQSKELAKEMDNFQKSYTVAKEQLSNFEKSIKSLQSFANSVLDYEHLEEIDDMWERLCSAESNIDFSLTGISEANEKIEGILQISHIDDLDYMWKQSKELSKKMVDFQKSFAEAKKQISSIENSIEFLQSVADSVLDYAHLEEIDDMWERLGSAEANIDSNLTGISEANEKIEGILRISHINDLDYIWNQLESRKNDVDDLNIKTQTLLEVKKKLDSQNHVYDIDAGWADIQKAKDDIANSAEQISKADQEIKELEENVSELKIFKKELLEVSHLFEVDNINEKLILANQEIEKLDSKNNNQLELIRELKSDLEDNEKRNNENSLILKSRLKLAYVISGCAVGLTIFQLVLNIVGVL
jgi:hypothetical protein